MAISGFSFARRDDRGSALIITLMVMALITALSSTVAVITINNLQASRQAQQAGSAINAADAGVAQAMSYLRTSGVKGLTCSPTCSANPWGNSTTPTAVSLPGPGGEAYKAWIEVVTAFPNATNSPGVYTIHSTGSAAGAAKRSVAVDVNVATDAIRAMFARTIDGGGSASVTRESVISTGCVYDRDHIHMVTGQMDAAYGIPIAVHSSQYITRSNGSGQYCPSSDNGLIHKAGACNTTYPYDQDLMGGSLASTSCASVATSYPSYYGTRDFDGDGSADVRGSYIKDDAALRQLFGIKSPPVSQARIDQLRAVAIAQGNYWTSASSWTSPDENDAVMFFDLSSQPSGQRTVNLNDVSGFGRASGLDASSAACPAKSLVIVIEAGNASLNSNQQLFASLILTGTSPYGKVTRANGTAGFVGSIYADSINLVGTVDISLDGCFLANLSPSLLDVQMSKYREDDRGLS